MTITIKTYKNAVSGVIGGSLIAHIRYEDGKTARYSNKASLPIATFINMSLNYFTEDAKENGYKGVDLKINREINRATAEHLADWYTCDDVFNSIVIGKRSEVMT